MVSASAAVCTDPWSRRPSVDHRVDRLTCRGASDKGGHFRRLPSLGAEASLSLLPPHPCFVTRRVAADGVSVRRVPGQGLRAGLLCGLPGSLATGDPDLLVVGTVLRLP